MRIKALVLGIGFALLAGSAQADSAATDGFSALAGIPKAAMSAEEMEEVQGRLFVPMVGNIGPSLRTILGPGLTGLLYPGGFWNTALFGLPRVYVPTYRYRWDGGVGIYRY